MAENLLTKTTHPVVEDMVSKVFARLIKENKMRTLLSVAVLMSLAVPAWAVVDAVNFVPEPDTLGLLGIGAIGLIIAMRRKK